MTAVLNHQVPLNEPIPGLYEQIMSHHFLRKKASERAASTKKWTGSQYMDAIESLSVDQVYELGPASINVSIRGMAMEEVYEHRMKLDNDLGQKGLNEWAKNIVEYVHKQLNPPRRHM